MYQFSTVRLLTLLSLLSILLAACNPQTEQPLPPALQPTATNPPISGVTPVITPIEATPLPTPVPTDEDLQWEDPDDPEDALFKAFQTYYQTEARGMDQTMMDRSDKVTMHMILQYQPPDRFRRFQGTDENWIDAITIGRKLHTRSNNSGWVTIDATDPAADQAAQYFSTAPLTKENMNAQVQQSLSMLGISGSRTETELAGKSSFDGKPTWLITQSITSPDGELLMTSNFWLGIKDGRLYKLEGILTDALFKQLSGHTAQIAATMAHMVILYQYDVTISAP